VLLNLVLEDEMRDVCRIAARTGPAAINAAVDEVFDVLLDGLVDESDALAFLDVASGFGDLRVYIPLAAFLPFPFPIQLPRFRFAGVACRRATGVEIM
jgi:hypothetical protein